MTKFYFAGSSDVIFCFVKLSMLLVAFVRGFNDHLDAVDAQLLLQRSTFSDNAYSKKGFCRQITTPRKINIFILAEKTRNDAYSNYKL